MAAAQPTPIVCFRFFPAASQNGIPALSSALQQTQVSSKLPTASRYGVRTGILRKRTGPLLKRQAAFSLASIPFEFRPLERPIHRQTRERFQPLSSPLGEAIADSAPVHSDTHSHGPRDHAFRATFFLIAIALPRVSLYSRCASGIQACFRSKNSCPFDHATLRFGRSSNLLRQRAA